MRKDKRQQKNSEGEQLTLFNMRNLEPAGSLTEVISKGDGSGVELSSRLERQRTLTEHLLEKIVDDGNLNKAFKQVKENDGSSGIDEMEVDQLREWLGKHLKELREALLTEKYSVNAVRKVEIPKATGGIRILGIPTVKDRFVQQAIDQELNRYYDPYFSDNSYGFRPGRSTHQAIIQATRYIKEGNEWVVDIDLEKFFDKINHDRLMQRLSKGIGDKRVLRLINAFLKTGIMEGGLMKQRTAGTPQGSPLSPLLSNIVLDELDRELEKRGHKFCRFADDCNIYVKSRKAGERVMASIVDFIEKKMKLKVNRNKSGVRHCSDVKFLGYTLLPEGGIRVADKSIDRFKGRIKEITKRNRGQKIEQIIKELNSAIIGWANYFYLADKWLAEIRDLDGWIRRKLRCYRLKQLGRKYTIVKFLMNHNIPANTSWNVVKYSQGWWHMSQKPAVGKAMNLVWFSRLGLQSIEISMTGKR
jgi:group II intron reverse transcriptase/maturase